MIIGITGTIGAGKGTFVDYLVEKKDLKHYSARAYITEEIERRGLPVDRDSMVLVANDLRAKNSPSFIIEELYRRAMEDGGDVVIESIRTPGEVSAMRGKDGFYLAAVDAEPLSRYERVKQRGSETDMVSFEEFSAQEEREMHADDPNKQNLAECIRQADYRLDNNGSFEDLYVQIENMLSEIAKK